MLLSILIRNLNESNTLKLTLLSIRRQVTSFPYEVVVVDNESDDDSVKVALDIGCRVYTMKRSDFSYGRALNYGIAQCRGSIIMSISAHVVLLNESFLESIPAYFTDEQVAGLRFVSASSAKSVEESLRTGAKRLEHLADQDFVTEHWTNFMVNHCSAFRRSLWESFPFDEQMPDGEDKLWTVQLLQKGFCFLYNVPNFYVYNKVHNREKKVKSVINAEIAKLMVSGKLEKKLSGGYVQSMYSKFREQIKSSFVQLIIHHKIYKGVRKFSKKYKR